MLSKLGSPLKVDGVFEQDGISKRQSGVRVKIVSRVRWKEANKTGHRHLSIPSYSL